MTDRNAIAIAVLEERLVNAEAGVQDALKRLRAAYADLDALLDQGDALRRSIELLGGRHRAEPTVALLSVRSRFREVFDELRMVERARREGARTRSEGAVTSVRGSVRAVPPRSPSKLAESRGGEAGLERYPPHIGTRDPSDVEAEAIRMAKDGDGRVRVRVLAQHLFFQDRGRYRDERSAYSSVFAQLERSNRFVRGERGEFVLIPPLGAAAAAPDPGDLPFE